MLLDTDSLQENYYVDSYFSLTDDDDAPRDLMSISEFEAAIKAGFLTSADGSAAIIFNDKELFYGRPFNEIIENAKSLALNGDATVEIEWFAK